VASTLGVETRAIELNGDGWQAWQMFTSHDHQMRIGRLVPLALVALGGVGCGGSSSGPAKNSSGRSTSPLVVHVSAPRHTGYHMPSSSMEPTLHFAKPGIGCLASHPDSLLVRRFNNAPRRGRSSSSRRRTVLRGCAA
jgi:hypothetical protein